jgi:Na+/H+ antiporter NhaC
MKKEEDSSRTAKESEKEVYASLTGADPAPEDKISVKGTVAHLVLPIIVLIVACVIGMIYTGGFFDGVGFVDAFAGSDASVGLVFGSVVALVLTIIFYLATRVLSFRECMTAIPEGFKSMVPAILILTFAWTLKSMTDALGAADYVAGIVESSAGNLIVLLPAIVFLVGCFLAFATGTSWGTFGILIPIVVSVFGGNMDNTLMIVSISACMAGAVCGDHCSPISDTTIMASAGAQCDHIAHVNTQLPYAITAAAISLVCYLLTGVFFVAGIAPIIMLPVGIVLTIVVMGVIKKVTVNKA